MTERVGRPEGGMKSEAGKAAYWRMQHEAAIGALADLIVEHRELVERIEALRDRWRTWPNSHDANGPRDYATALDAALSPTDPTKEGE